MGPDSHLQFLRESEGGASSAEAQRQLRCDQKPRETQLLVQLRAGTLPQVRTNGTQKLSQNSQRVGQRELDALNMDTANAFISDGKSRLNRHAAWLLNCHCKGLPLILSLLRKYHKNCSCLSVVLRSLQKGSWHHSSGPLAPGAGTFRVCFASDSPKRFLGGLLFNQ